MVTIETSNDKLTIYVKGIDVVLALKGKVEVPLQHVHNVESYDSYQLHEEKSNKVDWRLPGTVVPGVIKAGSFYKDAWAFWDVHHLENAIVIHLEQEHYKMLIVEVENPDLEIGKIRTALDSAPLSE